MSRKIKILFDARPIASHSKTGVGHYTSLLIKQIAENYANDVELTGFYFDFLGRRNLKPQPIEGVKYRKSIFIPLLIKLGLMPPLELFIAKKYELVLFTNFVNFPSFRKVPKITVIYDLSFFDYPEYTQEKNLSYMQKFIPKTVKRSSAIITISEFTKERISHYFPGYSRPILVTPIPPEISKPKKLELPTQLLELGIQKNNYILHIGTIEPRKNIINLLRAFEIYHEKNLGKLSLVLAGGKGWKDEQINSEIERLVEKGLKIICTGYVTEPEKAALYSNASIFIMPSHYEGFGMPILEAMAYKLAIAVSDIPVFHEVAGDAVLYFDQTNPSNISESIQKLESDTKLKNTMQEKMDYQLTKNNWDKISNDVFELIKSVAKG